MIKEVAVKAQVIGYTIASDCIVCIVFENNASNAIRAAHMQTIVTPMHVME